MRCDQEKNGESVNSFLESAFHHPFEIHHTKYSLHTHVKQGFCQLVNFSLLSKMFWKSLSRLHRVNL